MLHITYHRDIKDSFDITENEKIQEFIKEIVAIFHQRDAKKHADGSMGTIKISPKQFRDCIAFAVELVSNNETTNG